MLARDSGGNSALIFAAGRGHEAVVELLLAEKQHDPTITTAHKDTCLMAAALFGRTRIVEMLLADARVHPGARNGDGNTALSKVSAGTPNP